MKMEIELSIPEDRVGVLIGKEGEVKEKIENLTGCCVNINSKTGTVKIKCDDAINFMKVREVIRAISHGFSPEVAMKILDETSGNMIILDIIDLTDYAPPRHLERIKGRIIGKGGRMRKNIEDMLGVHVSVYNKTVSIIGDPEAVSIAREAILMLVEGAQHSTVQKFLENRRRDLKLREFEWKDIF